jgi:hypothetical protein
MKEFRQSRFLENSIMNVQQDFEELLELLNEQKVKYILVGGYALAFHGAPRFTGDMDIYVKLGKKNSQGAEKIWLREFKLNAE